MEFLPVFADLKNRPVLLVGGGLVASRKAHMLRKAQAKVRVVAATLHPELEQALALGQVEWIARAFAPHQLDDVFLAVAATDDTALNHAVFTAAEQRQKLVNVVDSPQLCSFIFPSVIDRSPVQVAISTGGHAPVLARQWRERLEALLPQGLGAVATVAGRWREAVRERIASAALRRRFWEDLLGDANFHHCAAHRPQEADAYVQAALNGVRPLPGSVSLVGAGPGDAGLLTLKGLQRIQEADVVLYDALVSADLLELVRRDAEKICVGKRAGQHSVQQDETNRLLVQHAQQGKRVVRLKGGDPFIFGRGGEELQTLKAAGIAFEVVPGITAALGAAAYAGIPLTHRDHAQSVMFITGHCRPDGKALAWPTLAQGNQTLVVYMGAIKAGELAEQLQAHGRAADTPVAVISQGTQASQQTLTGALTDLPALAAKAAAPALLVIGEVVALQRELAWFGHAPAQTSHCRADAEIGTLDLGNANPGNLAAAKTITATLPHPGKLAATA